MFQTDDRQFWDGDTSYYNVPSNIPVIPAMPPVKEDRNNNNDYDGYFMTEKETSYDVITSAIPFLLSSLPSFSSI